jgi:hypothetical protein
VPGLCELYPGICLATEDKTQENLSQGSTKPLGVCVPTAILMCRHNKTSHPAFLTYQKCQMTLSCTPTPDNTCSINNDIQDAHSFHRTIPIINGNCNSIRRRYASRYVLHASLPRTLQNFRHTRTGNFCHFCRLPRRKEGSLMHTVATWPTLNVRQCDTSQKNR